MKRLTVMNVDIIDTFKILKVCTNLVDATFTVVSTVIPNDDQMEPATYPGLHILEVHLPTPELHFSFTQLLQAPALTHLIVSPPCWIDVHSALPVHPTCLVNLTHIAFEYEKFAWDAREWIALLTDTPSVTHLKLNFFHDVAILLDRLSDTTISPTLAGLKVLMIDNADFDCPILGDETDHDETIDDLGFSLAKFARARFQNFPLSSICPMRNGMKALRVVFDGSRAEDFHSRAFYRWNGWPVGQSPSGCQIYRNLQQTFKAVVPILSKVHRRRAVVKPDMTKVSWIDLKAAIMEGC